MSFFVDRPRGMQDLFPPSSLLFDRVSQVMRDCALFYGFSSVRTPVLEFTELFDRSVGDSSDIVQKEMYTFNDKSGRSLTLRPEFTAGVLRAVVGNYSSSAVFPLKFMYCGPCYRYEKPQVGRFREFYQFGLEIFGGDSFLADLEIILVARDIFRNLMIDDFNLEINCIGCSSCKKGYLDSIRSFFEEKRDDLCDTCKNRLNMNPMRILDCKNESCKKLFSDAPRTVDFICESCKKDFEDLKRSLEIVGMPYVVNTSIVRGLDYYTKLVFEFIVNVDGVDLTICGGGRYDNLSSSLGGPQMSATGLAIGMERILKILQDKNVGHKILGDDKRDVFICYLDDSSRDFSVELSYKLHSFGLTSDYDIVGRGLKSQLKYADKMNYNFVIVIGSEELQKRKIKLKKMSDGSLKEFDFDSIDETFADYIKNN